MMTVQTRPRPPDRRAQLELIAADLFARHGYHNVAINDIAATAGISGPAIYRHFPSKQAILGHLVRSRLEQCAQVVESHLDGAEAGDPFARLRSTIEASARLVVERPELGALWRRERRHLTATDLAVMAERAERPARLLHREISRARPELSSVDAQLLGWAALSVLGSVSEHHVRLPKARFEQLLADLACAVLADGRPVPQSSRPVDNAVPVLDTRREQLLAVAARLFCERGYHAVTMEEIGAAAGIAGPSVYNHFASKSDLLLAACNRIGDRLRQGAAQAVGSGQPPARTLELMVDSFVSTVLECCDLVAAYLSEGDNLPDRERAEARRMQRAYAQQWARLVIAVRPELSEPEARVRVHAAYAVVNDIARMGRFAARPGLGAELRGLALALLIGTP
jgi:AcrR family transcriptional regulator